MQTPDTKPGAYYVSVIDGNRRALLLGPFKDDHAAALAKVDSVRKKAEELDPRAVWYAFGTCRINDDHAAAPLGKLNAYFNMPTNT